MKDTPLIQVTPVVKKVGCEVGKEVSLNCIVNAPYVVIFRGIPAAGKPNVMVSFLTQVFKKFVYLYIYVSQNVDICPG